MKPFCIFAIAVILSILEVNLTVGQEVKKQDDAERASLLLGKWTWSDSRPSYGQTVRKTFNKNQTFVWDISYSGLPGGESQHYQMSGKWKVVDGYLVQEITKSNLPTLVPFEVETEKNRVISIDRKQMRLVCPDEKTEEIWERTK